MTAINPITVNPPVMTPKQASIYLGIDTNTDALKSSRSTGILWGVPSPEYMKCGSKILYRKSVLDSWLEQFPTATNNAQLG